MTKKRSQLVVAVVALMAGSVLLWWITDALYFQRYYLQSVCWPDVVDWGSTTIPAEDFMRHWVDRAELSAVQEFFHTRMRHRILLYLMLSCAILGWAGSILLRILRADGEPSHGSLPTWESLVASLFLSALGGGILFLLLVSTRLAAQSSELTCISEGYTYFAAAMAIGCGLFVVLFFKWFEDHFPGMLGGKVP